MPEKDIVLFVHSIPADAVEDVRSMRTPSGKPFLIALIGDSKQTKWQEVGRELGVDFIIPVDYKKPLTIAKNLLPYTERLLAITSRAESKMNEFAKIVPHVPYLKTMNPENLRWASDKISMRERLRLFDKKITPNFTVVTDATAKTMKEVEKKLIFPIIIKPSGLAASRLVSLCYHKEEFEKSLQKTFKKIKKLYKEQNVSSEPRVIVEEFMEGSMYSVDGYVTTRGNVTFCPMVYVKTGVTIGFDDFFGYMQLTPTQLKPDTIAAAEIAATKAIHALGLRNCTAHVELMRTEDGWKVIEVGARIGGFRHDMYKLSFGINHTLNDVRVRIPKKVIAKKKIKGYTVAMKFFAKTEGVLQSVRGVKKIQELESFYSLKQNKKPGERCAYAKNGGSSVVNLILFNENRSGLFADIRRAEQLLKISIE